ncbi:Ig-like domain-containing protein [Pseudomonas piscis]
MWWSKQKSRTSQRVSAGAKARVSPMILSLEPRMLFDGAVAASVAEAAQPDSHSSADAAKPTATEQASAGASADTRPTSDTPATAAPVAAVPGSTVVFVDSRVKDSDALLKGVAPGTQVVQLDGSRDGLQQIADYLDTHQGVSSVQLIAHGNAGDLWLGDTYLSADNVAARSEVLAEIGKDMNVGGDIMIYACYTAEGNKGISFVDSLADLTGRDVAASTNRTGVGGDWTLEIATGTIESANVLSRQSMADYQWGLATWTATNGNDSGTGSLRAEIALAQNGDIVTFQNSMTVTLNSELLITKNITVDGDLNNDGIAEVTLDGQYKTRVLEISSGATVTLDGLIITKGLVSGNGGDGGSGATGAMAGGIFNAGILTLNNVTVTANAAAGGGGGGGVTPVYYGGGGGGGGGVNGSGGGHGGAAGPAIGNPSYPGPLAGGAASAGSGGFGGSFNGIDLSGRGGTTTGGAGGNGIANYSTGGAGATATAGTLSIGGGGGGSGWDNTGGRGGNAAGGIYNAASGSLTIIGASHITNNVGAGGGGGGGGGLNASPAPGGAGGIGVGAIWNKGTLLMTASNLNAITGNAGAGGTGGGAKGGGATGATGTSQSLIYNDGGTVKSNLPEATITFGSSTLGIGQSTTVTITFSAAVTGFTASDLTVANGTLSGLSTSNNITWTAIFTPTIGITDTTNVITLDNSGVAAALDGTVGAGKSVSGNYIVDTVRPTASIVVASPSLNIGSTSLVTITFSEAVTGFTNADLTVENGNLSALSSIDGGITWTATFTPTSSISDTSNVISLDNSGVADAAGNAGSGTTSSNNYAIDTLRPTATIVVADSTLTTGETSLVTITFSEAVTGFTNTDLTIENGTLSAVSSSDGGKTWTATLTPTAQVNDTTNIISLNNAGISDLAGNLGMGTTSSGNYIVNTLSPSATIVVDDTSLSIGETSLVTFTFTQAVSGFDNSDITVANGTLSNVSSSDGGVTWTATLTPTANITDASNVITVDNAGVNAGGTAGIGISTSNNYAIDGVRPTATIVMSNPTLAIGSTSLVTITFSEAVTGLTNGDLSVANGNLSTVSSSDGGVTWTATFTPNLGVTDASNVISLDSTGIADLTGNAGSGVIDSGNYSIDTARPTVSIVLADTQLTAGETTQVTFTFSEAVNNFSNADLTISNGTLSAVSSSDGGITWTATFTPSSSVRAASNVISLASSSVADLAGNANSGVTNSGNFTIDTVRPTATILLSDNALKAGETSTVTITFDQAVTGFTNADLTVVGGTLSAVSSSDGGITWTATFTPAGNINSAANHITLDNSGIQAAASGNAGAGVTLSNDYSIDTQRPTATIVVANDHLGIGGSSQVTITFSEAVTGFTLSDLAAANGTLSNLSTVDNITWTATLVPAAGVTVGNNRIALTNSGVFDGAGNAGSGTTDSNVYVIDSVRPTATIVLSDPTLSAGESSTVTITFSEAVMGLDNGDLSAPNGTLSTVSSSDGGITWTATYTPNANVRDTSNVITLNNSGYTDLAGNTGIGVTNSANFTLDTVRPTATIVVASPALNVGSSTQVTITFSEAVSGFTNADLTVEHGTLSAVSSSDGGITWTATFTPEVNITDTTNLITLDNSGVQNASGNAGSGTTTSNSYAIDTQRPTASITVADSSLGIGQTTTVTIAFSEVVSGFDLSDLTVANGTLSNLLSSDGGKTWTATLTPTAAITDATNLIVLDTALVSDGAGNTGSGISLSNNYAIDGDRPTATIVVANPSLAVGQTTQVTITFSEAVSGFSNADLSVPNGTLSAVSSSDGGKTWTATFTPDANVQDTSNLITLDNTGYTDLAGNTGLGVTQSANFSIDTTRPTATIVVATPSLNAGSSSLVTITFSEAVNGFTLADLSVENGTLSNLGSSDGGKTWTATLTPGSDISDTSNLIVLDNSGVQDASGNSGSGTTASNNYAIDTQRPTATISVADSNLGIGQTTTVTIAFSEAVSGFSLADLSVANGTLSNLASSDGGKTWTATLTPTAGITDATNLIVLDASSVIDAAGNLGSGIAISNNYAMDADRPTATIVVANPNLTAGQTTQVTFTFSEKVTDFDLSDLSVANGVLSDLVSSDGGKTWTATLTPTANITDPSNFITLDNSLVTDLAGNAGTGFANSNNYALTMASVDGDPQFRITDPARPAVVSDVPLQPVVFGPPTGDLGSPLGFPPLFEQRTTGGGLPPIGSIFINHGALAPSFIAQVFATDGIGDGSGKGFLGFGGGDGGVFGSSTLSTLFNRDADGDPSALSAFDRQADKGQGDVSQGLRGVFGAPTLGQQLQQLKDNEQKQLHELAWALEQAGINPIPA